MRKLPGGHAIKDLRHFFAKNKNSPLLSKELFPTCKNLICCKTGSIRGW